jgi:hypothetical protein
MKRIYMTLALVGAFVSGSYGQTLADIEVVMIKPAGTQTTPFAIPCTDSFDYEFLLINHGPGTIGAADTVQYYSPWVPDGYINTTTHGGVAIPAHDTIVHYAGKTHRNELERLFDPSSGEPMYKPFSDGDYLFAILVRGFRNVDTAILKDPNSANNDVVAFSNIDCSTGIGEAFKGLDKQSLNVYPNPASNTISFKATMTNGSATLRISDMVGRTVLAKDFGKQTAGEKELTLDVSALNNGMYYIELFNEGNRYVNKLTIRK